MRRLTAAQKEVELLTTQIPNLTLRQAILLRQKMVRESAEGFYYKGTARCTSCGQVWQPQINEVGEEMTCPCCGTRLKMTNCRKASIKQSKLQYVTISQAFKGWQVTRTYIIEQTLRKDCRTNYDYRLVQEYWVSAKGHVLLQSSKAMGFWHCREGKGWSFDVSIRTDSAYYQMRSEVDLVESVIPELRKRGFVGKKAHDFYLQPLFRALMEKPDFESYWKRGLFMLCGRLMDRKWDKEIDVAVKIFLRHNKSGWTSKNHMNDWFDMVEALNDLGRDLHSPHYVCPENFKEAHDRWIKLRERHRKELEKKRRHKEAVEKAKRQTKLAERYVKERGIQFKDLCISSNDITIKVLPDVQAFIEEADYMEHCVCRNEYYNLETHPNSLILSARTDDWTNRLETIEVNLKTYTITQSRGHLNNDTPRHSEIVNLVQRNMNLIRQHHHRKIV